MSIASADPGFLPEFKRKVDKLNRARVPLSFGALEKLGHWASERQLAPEENTLSMESFDRIAGPFRILQDQLLASICCGPIDARYQKVWRYVQTRLLPEQPTIRVMIRDEKSPFTSMSFWMEDRVVTFGTLWEDMAKIRERNVDYFEVDCANSAQIQTNLKLLCIQPHNRLLQYTRKTGR